VHIYIYTDRLSSVRVYGLSRETILSERRVSVAAADLKLGSRYHLLPGCRENSNVLKDSYLK